MRYKPLFFVISPTKTKRPQKTMTKISKIFFLLFAVILQVTMMESCRKFDFEQFREIVKQNYLIDSIDEQHTWNLLKERAVRIKSQVDDPDIAYVQVLDGNPFEKEGVEILANRLCTDGNTVSPTFSVPATKTEFWAAAVTNQGKYYVIPIEDKSDVVIGGSRMISNKLMISRPVGQTFTYMFEEDYPYPGDFDFNDVVLRISQQAVAQNKLKLTVTLAAVGATKQLGAAIRFPLLKSSDIEKVTIDEGRRFDEGYPVERYFIDDEKVLVRGRDGSAVINLFDDAHWCMNSDEKNGQVVRMYYNTRNYEVKNESVNMPTVSRTYNIYLNEGIDASFLQLSDIDPFIIANSNGLVVEVHTFTYKYSEAIWHYTNGPGSEDDMVPWALMVPDGNFRYPVEEMFLGRYRNGESTGAYSRYGHSFGEWGRNHTKSEDWWLYPSEAQVYQP